MTELWNKTWWNSCKNSPFDEYAKIETGRDGAVTVWEYNPEDNKVTANLECFY